MTLDQIITAINNGDVPSFNDLAPHFDGMDMWHIRNACFGSTDAAINFCNARGVKWHITYGSLAIVDDITEISVTPGHALIIAAIRYVEKKRAGALLNRPPVGQGGTET